jgi:hypothetical protein
MNPIADTCYIPVVPKVVSEPVISFFKRGKSFVEVCSFYFDDICKPIRVDSGEDPVMRRRGHD